MAETQEIRDILLWNLTAIGWNSEAPDLVEAMILLASIQVGADEAVIAETLGLPWGHVSAVGMRLREGGIWVDDRVAHAGRWAGMRYRFSARRHGRLGRVSLRAREWRAEVHTCRESKAARDPTQTLMDVLPGAKPSRTSFGGDPIFDWVGSSRAACWPRCQSPRRLPIRADSRTRALPPSRHRSRRSSPTDHRKVVAYKSSSSRP
jgi:hypothetical protein